MASRQYDTRDKTERLQEEMKDAQAKNQQGSGEGGQGGKDGQPGQSGQQGEKPPGMAQIQKAQQSMENAGNNLGRQEADSAASASS